MADWDYRLTINGTTYPLASVELGAEGQVRAELVEREMTLTCPGCGGAGYLFFGSVTCGRCRGSGAITETDGYLTLEPTDG